MKFSSVDEYIASFPADVREVLEEVRRTIRAVVPAAGEKISYDIPTITLDGKSLLHFSAWKHHLAVYPVPPVDEALAADLNTTAQAKAPSSSH
ncbi:iron chaperone [Kribbella sp. NPDC055071]